MPSLAAMVPANQRWPKLSLVSFSQTLDRYPFLARRRPPRPSQRHSVFPMFIRKCLSPMSALFWTICFFVTVDYVIPIADVFGAVNVWRFFSVVVPLFDLIKHGRIYRNYVITQFWMVPVYGVASIHDTFAFQFVYWKNIS